MLNELEFLFSYILQRAETPRVMSKLSESDLYTMGYVDGLAEVLSVTGDLMEEYKLRTEYHDGK